MLHGHARLLPRKNNQTHLGDILTAPLKKLSFLLNCTTSLHEEQRPYGIISFFEAGPGREKGPARIPRGPLASGIGKCPPLVSGVLLSHGLTPQYHRRSGA